MRSVARFKAEQSAILAEIEDARTLGVGTDQGTQRVIELRDRILDHLGDVDRKMYPMLRAAARKDSALQTRLDKHLPAASETSAMARAFFDTHEDNPGEDFLEEWGQLYVRLRTRFRHEENVFFKVFGPLELSTLRPVGRASAPPPRLFVNGDPKK